MEFASQDPKFNMDPFAIAYPRELSLRPKVHFLMRIRIITHARHTLRILPCNSNRKAIKNPQKFDEPLIQQHPLSLEHSYIAILNNFFVPQFLDKILPW
jgi:hypothetical protein